MNKTNNIGEYILYLGTDSEYCFINSENGEFHLLGSIYDWEFIDSSNQDILGRISLSRTIDEAIKAMDKYCGEFVLIMIISDKVYILNDASCQSEVYYDDGFSCFGTQPKLIGLATKLFDHVDDDAIEFYNSKIFKEKCLFIGKSTHKSNVFHLLPNHYLNIEEKCAIRFFPNEILEKKPAEQVARNCSEMLRGYISAISKRGKIKMGVTAGYDSRVLFLGSLGVDCEYFVSKYPFMNDSHYDIIIPKKLTKYYNKGFTILNDDDLIQKSSTNVSYINDIDFPRFLNLKKYSNDATYINGNISETARNYFGYHKNATAEDLSFLSGNSTLSFPVQIYDQWLRNKVFFEKLGYHYLDMFYWEERMGIWGAKFKTESRALGIDFISPFNSRSLLKLLLGTERKYRDSHFNLLYDMMIFELSGQDKHVARLAINPCTKQSIIRLMKIFRTYNLYRHIGVKTKFLNV